MIKPPNAVARTLIVGVNIHTFKIWPTSFISNQIQIDQFEKKICWATH